MTKEENDLIQYRLARSKETLEEARLLYAAGHYNASLNRLYYACFYAVLALLQTKGLFSRKHSGVRALFNTAFIQTGEIEKEWSRFYADLFESRQEGDYEEFVRVEKEYVQAKLLESERFVQMISQKLVSYNKKS
jgi:uncharacterized protein (UPF0332 family)